MLAPRSPSRAPLVRALIIVAATVAAALGNSAPPAAAAVAAPTLLDGPAAEIEQLDGVAMAPDGTGGVVYRKLDGGRPHVFAAAFRDGRWSSPQRVDVGATQSYASSWPAIGAGNDGRLVVVWVQEFGAADRFFSATLQPGARRFEAPVPVDLNVGDSALGTWPHVAMAAGGQALVTYRVITDPQPTTAPGGSVLGELRLARLGGQLWSSYGTPLNRNVAAAQPAPTADNRPRVGIDRNGAGVVAWTELDDAFVPRVYMRRVFPGGLGVAQQVPPTELDGARTKGADSFALAVGANGEAALAWRQESSASGEPPRAWLASMPDQFAEDARAFAAPRLIDGGAAPGLQPPALAIAGGDVLVGLSRPGTALLAEATETTAEAPQRVDSGDAAAQPRTQVTVAGDGAAAAAWVVGTERSGGVRLLERRDDGAGGDRRLTGPRGGGVDALELAGSGAGDALVAFTQGTGAGRQLVVGAVDAAPQTFSVQAPLDWVRGATVGLLWDRAVSAVGRVTYSVVVDDDVVAEGVAATRYTLRTKGLPTGRRTVSVVATDAAGQETSSLPATLRVDRAAPTVTVRVRRGRVEVRLRDRGAGVKPAGTQIRIGRTLRRNRTRAAVRPGAGLHRVTVRASDRAGNVRRYTRQVRVR